MSIRRLVFAASLFFGLAGCQAQGLQNMAGSQGVSYAQPAQQEDLLTALHQRGRELLQVYQSTLFRNPDVKARGYDTIAYTALNGCGPSHIAEDMVDILRPDLIAKSADKAAYAFVLPPITRYLLQYNQCLTTSQITRARDLLATPQPLFIHGTLNHAIMSATSYYLLAEHFHDQQWTDSKGKVYTSSEVASRYKALLLARFAKFMADGYNEQLSPTYGVANIFPLLNLSDFAQDRDVRLAAEQLLVAEIGLMRADSLDGALVPPTTRENAPPQLTTNPPTNARDLLWFYYGDFGPIDGRRYELPYGAMLAASSWRPPTALLSEKPESSVPYDISVTTPSFGVWDQPTHPEQRGGAWIDRDFAVGAGTIEADPSGSNEHTVAFRILLRGRQPVGAIDCYQPYWLSNEGPDAWDLDRSSPFQQSWRSGSRGVLLYDIPASDPYQYPGSNRFFAERVKAAGHLNQIAECRFPQGADALDTRPTAVFARYGRVFVALLSLSEGPVKIDRNPTGANLKGFMTLKVSAPRTAIYYQAEPARAGDTLADFESRVTALQIRYNPSEDQASFIGLNGRTVFARFEAQHYPPAEEHFGTVAKSPIFNWAAGSVNFGANTH